MRVLVLAFAVALAACNEVNPAPEFISGNTYVYKYEAFVMGGLPEEGLARAGVKVRCKVLIRAEAPDIFIMKLNEPEIFEYNGIWPKEPFVPATKLTSALAPQLMTPIKFEYANGVVGKVFALAGVSETVLNIYRGVLNIFQLNIKKTQKVYEQQESGVNGVCKTHYVIRQDEKADRIMLTKTKYLNHCQERIMKDIGLAYTEKCYECTARGKALEGALVFDYIMKETATGAMILEATATELIQFSPFNILNGATQMEAKQRLSYLEMKTTPVILIGADYLHRGSLQYEFATELLQNPIQLLRISNAEAQIDEILNHLVTFNMAKAHEDAPLKFIELIQLLRVVRYESIEALWNRYKARPDYRYWILNSVPAIGTHVALSFFKEKYLAGELTIVEASQTLMASVHMVTADPEAIKIAKELFMNEKIKGIPVLREIVRLGYGTLVAKYCVENPTCPDDLVWPVHEYLVDVYARGEIEELVVALKVLGNAGHPASLKPIIKLLPGFGSAGANLPHRVHIESALALRNIAKKEPKMVQEVAIELFKDKSLHAELRMVAAIILFETKLPMGLVTTIADALLKENNLQVASFVYSYMKAMTKSTAPDFASVASACNVAVKILSPKYERLSYRYSRTFYFDDYYNSWMMGAAASAFYINDAASVMPKAIVAKACAYLAGAHIDVFEFGLRTEGVQEALLKNPELLENADRLTKMKQVMDALSNWRANPKRQPLASFYVKFFGQEIAFANIDKAIIDQITEHATGPAMQTTGRKILDALLSGFSMHYAVPMLVAEVRRIIPTTVGLPMELSFYTAAVTAASVELQATVTPPLPRDFHASQLLKSDISMRAAISPSVSMHTYAVMGVNTALIQAAVLSKAVVHTIVPAKIEARIDIDKGNYKLHLLPVENINKIAAALAETFTFARNVEDLAAARYTPMIPAEMAARQSRETFSSGISKMSSSLASDMSASSEIISGDLSRPFIGKKKLPKLFGRKMCAAFETFGFKACTTVESFNAAYIRHSPLYAMIGKHEVLVEVTPVAGPVIERIEIEIQVGDKAAEKIIRLINQSEEEEILEDRNVLMKLKKVLAPSRKNKTATSSSSSSSRSSLSSSSSSKSSSSSSSSLYSKSSSSSASSSRSSLQGRSSSSSRSSALSKQELHEKKFTKNHMHQHALSTGRSNSKSSASSFEAIYNKTKYLTNIVPVVTILIRPVRADKKIEGYQIAAYFDKATSRVQLIFANLVESNHWRMCADGVMLSHHKLMAKVAWGIDCKQYETQFTAETGVVGKEPAVSLTLTWEKLPNSMKRYAKRLSEYISHISGENAFNQAKAKNVRNQIKLIAAVASDTSVDVVLKTPKRTMYKLGLPISLPLGYTAAELEPYQNNLAEKLVYMVTKAHAVECTIVKDTVMTFNKRKFKNEMPHSCYQVLAQDCTSELKFIVLLKRDQVQETNQINVKIAEIEVNMYLRGSVIVVNVNGMELNSNNLPYQHPTAKIQIINRGDGVALQASSYGLQEIYFGVNAVKVEVADWMRGQTCGLCGKADGEIRQEFRTPNKRLTKNAVSFAHSWVLPGKTCRDASECYMKLESVKLEQQMLVHGQDSKCFSVEPVLRCLRGCTPLRVINAVVGYHCVPAGSSLNHAVVLSNIYGKSVDLTATTEAHLACRCTAQCS